MSMKVSVVMATYNGAKYLVPQLNSLSNQDRLPDELIVFDDNSEDQTVAVLLKEIPNIPFPVDINSNEVNLGYTRNFELALRKAAGDIVFMCDQDDYWYPNKISRMLSIIDEQPEYLVYIHDVILADERLVSTGLTKLEQVRRAGMKNRHYVMGCAVAVRGSFLRQLPDIPDGYAGHDRWICNLADMVGAKYIVDEPLQLYRRHGKNTSQIIANQLRPVGPVRKFWYRFGPFFNGEISSKEKLGLRSARAVLKGLRELASTGSNLPFDFATAADQMDLKVHRLECRNKLRHKNFLERAFAVRRHYISGGYSEDNGIKSALRDIWG